MSRGVGRRRQAVGGVRPLGDARRLRVAALASHALAPANDNPPPWRILLARIALATTLIAAVAYMALR